MLSLFLTKVNSQVSSYTYAQSNSAYSAITGGAIYGATSDDDNSYNAINIGFPFKYNCIDYNQISISANGFIAFGSSVLSSYTPISSGASNNVVSALGHDTQGNSSTSQIRVELLGSAPNRILVIQWLNWKTFGGTTDNYNFQIRLKETSNIIEFHYNAFVKDATNRTVEIGLRGASNADFKNLSCTGAWTGAVAGGVNTATVDLQTARIPANGQKYTFTPPATAMTYSSSNIIDIAAGASISKCATDVVMSRVEIVTAGGCNSPINLSQLLVNMTGTAPTTTVNKVHVYYTGTSATYSAINEFVVGGQNPAASLTFNATQALSPGTNYFWIVYDFNGTGTNTNTIGADMPNSSLTVGGSARTPTATPNCLKTYIACPSGPGGVTTGLSHWVKSDVGVTGNPVTNWSDNSTLQILGDLVCLSAAARPSVQTGVINYQNYIRFDGTDDGMSSTNSVTAVSSGLFGNSDNSIFMVKNNRQAGNTGFGPQVDFKWESASSGPYRVGFEVETTNQRFDFVDDADGKNVVSTTNMIGLNRLVSVLTQSTSSSISVNGLADATKNFAVPLSLSGAGAFSSKLFLGCNNNSAFPIFADVDMAEEIIFNNRLNATDQLKVESYLAVKYGITLGNSTTPSNYIASNATVTWAGLSAYQKNIIGIGRDDNATLYTKQSRQADDTVRIYMNTIQTTNAANTANITNDRSFVIQGSDDRKLCSTASAMTEVPSGLASCAITSRLEREWRVTRTNMAQNYNMDIKLNACGAPGSVTVAHLRLLVDDDGNFGNGGTQCYYNGDGTGIVFTYSNPTITISNISTAHIPNNGTKFITIASINPGTPLPIEIIYFDAKLNQKETVDLTWETSSERNNDYFTMEKSTDGINWDFLGTVDGSGTTNIPQTYYLEDKNPSLGINYYKLLQTDFDGTISEAGIRSVELYSKETFILSPNPGKNLVAILGENLNEYNVEIFNNLGEKVQVNLNQLTSSKIELHTQNLAAGIYYVSLKSNSTNKVLKLIIEN